MYNNGITTNCSVPQAPNHSCRAAWGKKKEPESSWDVFGCSDYMGKLVELKVWQISSFLKLFLNFIFIKIFASVLWAQGCGHISLGLYFSVYRALCLGIHKTFDETSNDITWILALGEDYYSRFLLFFKVLLAITTGEAEYPVLIFLLQIHQCFRVNLSVFKSLNTTNLL